MLPARVGGFSHFKNMSTQGWWLVLLLQEGQSRGWLFPQKEPLQRCQKKQLTGQILPLLLSAAAACTWAQAEDSWYINSQVSVHHLLEVSCQLPSLRKEEEFIISFNLLCFTSVQYCIHHYYHIVPYYTILVLPLLNVRGHGHINQHSDVSFGPLWNTNLGDTWQ